MRLFNSTVSGNCYKVRLLLAHLGIPYETIDIDVGQGTRPEELLRLNPTGRVPLLILDDGRALPESDAILWHLAGGTPYLPEDAVLREDVLRWMFFEQNLHEPTIAVARFLITHDAQPERHAPVLAFLHRRGVQALDAMERHLRENPFFVGERYTIADIALYAYTHVAEEGRFPLEPHPSVRAWLKRIASQPGHVPMA